VRECVCVCMRLRVCVCMFLCACVCLCMCVYVCMCAFACVLCVCVYVCALMYVCVLCLFSCSTGFCYLPQLTAGIPQIQRAFKFNEPILAKISDSTLSRFIALNPGLRRTNQPDTFEEAVEIMRTQQ
jgi:hypothetical protein